METISMEKFFDLLSKGYEDPYATLTYVRKCKTYKIDNLGDFNWHITELVNNKLQGNKK